MPTITRDLPYYGVTYHNNVNPGLDVSGSDVVSTTDTSTEFVLPDYLSNISGGNYGVGPDFINYPTDIPSGYTLTEGRYVVIAYTEAGDAIPVSTTGWGYTPSPETEPFLLNFGNGTFNIVDHLPVGAYSGETVQRTADPSFLGGGPAGSWRIAESALYNGDPNPPIHVAYLAIRLTYMGSGGWCVGSNRRRTLRP